MMKVYVTCHWDTDQALLETIKKFGFGKTTWKNLEFTVEPRFDRVVVLNHPNPKSLNFSSEKAICFRLEPPNSHNYVRQSEDFIIPGYMHWPLWHKLPDQDLSKVYRTDLIQKKHLFSTVTSDLAYMDGHIERLLFIHFLDQYIVEGFDVWGRNTSSGYFNNIKSYRGELDNKYDGLMEYSYNLAVENSFIEDYFTEKITDSILSECLCFYAGCTNIEEYIDSRAYCKIDLRDKEAAKEKIIRVIRDRTYEKNIKYIKLQKQRLLTELNPLNLMWIALNEYDYLNKIRL
ncbi:glycosyltransferase family 10 [Sphingobacterium thalpophilum]|uniref:glycosyltransferase family 10 domain-containing protein n=1 Tax=Sphingobacterium thalpophilum TaxID=259 RepID=UPI0031DEACA7